MSTKGQIKKYEKHGSKFDKDIKFFYAHESAVMSVMINNRSPKSVAFKSRLGFSHHDITLKKESSVLKSIMDTFEGENTETQYSVLTYRIDLYFHDYKLAIEVDEKGHKDRNSDHETR